MTSAMMQRVEDDPGGLADAAFLPLGSRCHAHWPLVRAAACPGALVAADPARRNEERRAGSAISACKDWASWLSARGGDERDGLNDDDGLGHRTFVGERHVDDRLVARPATMALSRASAPPVSFMVGRPDGRLTTPMSRQNTPLRKPVPSALAQASLAAKRLA